MKKHELIALGLSPSQIKAVHALSGVSINACKAQMKKTFEIVDELEIQVNELKAKIKKFEDVDVKVYKTQIAILNNELEKQKKEYDQERKKIMFEAWLEEELKLTGVMSTKALRAELNKQLDELWKSNDPKKDLDNILEKNKERFEWMIKEDQPVYYELKQVKVRQ